MTLPQIEDQDLDESASSALSGQDLLLWSALPDLSLNIAQTAALCGVSVRQLGYWTKQGYVTATGKGARRLYGPASLRRILSIRQAMVNGLSLRQALRSLDDVLSPAYHPVSLRPGLGSGEVGAEGANPLSSVDMEAVSSDLLALLQRNRQIRDGATGLSAKLGRAEADVRPVAEHLTAHGLLQKSYAGSEAVYSLAEGGLP